MRSFLTLVTSLSISGTAYAQSRTEYDYIICGGGTAGLAVANRLTEDPNLTVLVVEAGINGTTDSWAYHSTPQEFLHGRVLNLPAGRTVGGSSQINGKVYSRPDSSSIDDWGRVNDAGWSWETLFPFYKASESLTIPSEDQQNAGNTYNPGFHGFSGPLNVSFPAVPNTEFWAILEATADNISLPVNKDFNGGYAHGISTFPAEFVIQGVREQHRESSREAYYLPVDGRPNLELLDQTTCLRLIWGEGKSTSLTATGVEIATTNDQINVSATKEIILSAGAYRSAGLLEFSGVGNTNLLQSHDIEVKIDLPGVGENLQDQMQGSIIFEISNTSNFTFPTPIGDELTTNYIAHLTYEDVFGDDAGDVRDRVNASLPDYASTISNAINGSLSADQILNSLEVQYHAIFTNTVPAVELMAGEAMTQTITWQWWPLIPLGRGNVHISGGNPETAASNPTINNNFAIVDFDWDIYIASGHYVRRFFAAEPLNSQVTQEVRPGLQNLTADASDDDWRAYWTDHFRVGYHPIGSCAMLPRAWGGVVDGDLRVYGTANVRVVDASVIPFNMGGHPSSSVYALAERASRLILTGERG